MPMLALWATLHGRRGAKGALLEGLAMREVWDRWGLAMTAERVWWWGVAGHELRSGLEVCRAVRHGGAQRQSLSLVRPDGR
jgi:hypothetical protein